MVLIVLNFVTGAKVSLKSMPRRCLSPRAQRRALYLMPEEDGFSRKIHLHGITLAPTGRGTNC
jgi:hypothetical protein